MLSILWSRPNFVMWKIHFYITSRLWVEIYISIEYYDDLTIKSNALSDYCNLRLNNEGKANFLFKGLNKELYGKWIYKSTIKFNQKIQNKYNQWPYNKMNDLTCNWIQVLQLRCKSYRQLPLSIITIYFTFHRFHRILDGISN